MLQCSIWQPNALTNLEEKTQNLGFGRAERALVKRSTDLMIQKLPSNN